MRRSLDAARLGHTDKIDGFKRLDRFVRAVERRYSPEADFDAVLAHEHAISAEHGGRRRQRPPSPPRTARSVLDDGTCRTRRTCRTSRS
jgi:hypothetical protein